MPAPAPLVPVRPAPRSLEPSPGPLEIFADGLAIEIRRDDRVLYDSPLEQRGFELVVPPRPARGATTSECADALSAPSMSTGGCPLSSSVRFSTERVSLPVPRPIVRSAALRIVA